MYYLGQYSVYNRKVFAFLISSLELTDLMLLCGTCNYPSFTTQHFGCISTRSVHLCISGLICNFIVHTNTQTHRDTHTSAIEINIQHSFRGFCLILCASVVPKSTKQPLRFVWAPQTNHSSIRSLLLFEIGFKIIKANGREKRNKFN